MISNLHHTTINNQTYEDSKYDELGGLFPSEATTRQREGNNDTILGGAASIFDSQHKDKNIENIKEVLVDLRNEQAFTQR